MYAAEPKQEVVPRVKVWNEMTHDFAQEVKGKKYAIPAGKHIELDIFEANDLLSAYFPYKKLKSGLQDPMTMKKLRMERIDGKALAGTFDLPPNRCMHCGYDADDGTELDEHLMDFHLNDMSAEDVKKVTVRHRAAQKKAAQKASVYRKETTTNTGRESTELLPKQKPLAPERYRPSGETAK
jgi:hypothetical protein